MERRLIESAVCPRYFRRLRACWDALPRWRGRPVSFHLRGGPAASHAPRIASARQGTHLLVRSARRLALRPHSEQTDGVRLEPRLAFVWLPRRVAVVRARAGGLGALHAAHLRWLGRRDGGESFSLLFGAKCISVSLVPNLSCLGPSKPTFVPVVLSKPRRPLSRVRERRLLQDVIIRSLLQRKVSAYMP